MLYLHSIVIPLEQGLRRLTIEERRLIILDSIVIPLEQGLRPFGLQIRHTQPHSIFIPLQQGLRQKISFHFAIF